MALCRFLPSALLFLALPLAAQERFWIAALQARMEPGNGTFDLATAEGVPTTEVTTRAAALAGPGLQVGFAPLRLRHLDLGVYGTYGPTVQGAYRVEYRDLVDGTSQTQTGTYSVGYASLGVQVRLHFWFDCGGLVEIKHRTLHIPSGDPSMPTLKTTDENLFYGGFIGYSFQRRGGLTPFLSVSFTTTQLPLPFCGGSDLASTPEEKHRKLLEKVDATAQVTWQAGVRF